MTDTLIAVACALLYLPALSVKAWWIYHNSLTAAEAQGDMESPTDGRHARH